MAQKMQAKQRRKSQTNSKVSSWKWLVLLWKWLVLLWKWLVLKRLGPKWMQNGARLLWEMECIRFPKALLWMWLVLLIPSQATTNAMNATEY